MNLGTTIKVMGGLLPQQLLERVAAGDPALPGTKTADYHQDSSNELNQTINRAWAALTGRWASFKAARAALPEGNRATALTRDRWLLPLFQELGYGRLPVERTAIIADDRPFAISHRWSHVPIHLLGAGLSLDKRIPGERGAAASPPHGLVQDLLNHAAGHRDRLARQEDLGAADPARPQEPDPPGLHRLRSRGHLRRRAVQRLPPAVAAVSPVAGRRGGRAHLLAGALGRSRAGRGSARPGAPA